MVAGLHNDKQEKDQKINKDDIIDGSTVGPTSEDTSETTTEFPLEEEFSNETEAEKRSRSDQVPLLINTLINPIGD